MINDYFGKFAKGEISEDLYYYHISKLNKQYDEYYTNYRFHMNKVTDYEKQKKGLVGDGVFINGQGDYKDYIMDAKANLANNGCGLIATYNALVVLDDYTSMPDIIESYSDNILSYPLGRTEAGLFLPSIGQYFKEKGYSVEVDMASHAKSNEIIDDEIKKT